MDTPSHLNAVTRQLTRLIRRGLVFLLGVLALVAAPAGVYAQKSPANHYGLVFLKDGFVLQGRINQEGTATETDPVTGASFSIPKGFFLVDDGPRRIIFSPQQVRLVSKMDPPLDDRIDNPKIIPVFRTRDMPAIVDVIQVGAFGNNLERPFNFMSSLGIATATNQKIGTATSYFVRMDSTKNWPWASVYLTRELNPDDIAAFFAANPNFEEKPGIADSERATRRFRYADFFFRAGWYDNAEKELDRILKDIPAEKERVTERQEAINRVRAREDMEAIKRLHGAGQHKAVQERLAKFSDKNAAEDVLASYREIQAEYAGVEKRGREVVVYLNDLAPKVDAKTRDLFTEAAMVIQDDLKPDTVPRLETFLSQARQAERQQKASKTPDLNPTELMSLAVTGWLLGNGAAEATPGVAMQLWRTRQMLIAYLSDTKGEITRGRLLTAYLSQRNDSTALDDILRMIPTLPPAEPETTIVTEKTVEVKLPRNITYQLRLPPEYRHGRAYPVLIVLHKSGETPAAMIDKWADAAAENGYILAAPEWEHKVLGYTYDDQGEHRILWETLRDLRRRFQVDSDRVFLFGQGQGANMAHDVGLSHPDLFAGIVSMGVEPLYYGMTYWRSAQYLPFYVITGTQSGKAEDHVHDLFKEWVSRSFPTLWVNYKGRGIDWFGGELPNIFDWMREKRRAFPIHQLGRDGLGEPFGEEFYTLRQSDNHFYWLSTNDIADSLLIPSVKLWRNFQPARMSAKIDSAKNEIHVATGGLRQITIWLGRNAKGENMVDFDKPITVLWNLDAPVTQRLTPSAAVLLEDLYERGDRQRLFLQKIPLTKRH